MKEEPDSIKHLPPCKVKYLNKATGHFNTEPSSCYTCKEPLKKVLIVFLSPWLGFPFSLCEEIEFL